RRTAAGERTALLLPRRGARRLGGVAARGGRRHRRRRGRAGIVATRVRGAARFRGDDHSAPSRPRDGRGRRGSGGNRGRCTCGSVQARRAARGARWHRRRARFRTELALSLWTTLLGMAAVTYLLRASF